MKQLPHRTRLVLFGIVIFFVIIGYEFYGKEGDKSLPSVAAVFTSDQANNGEQEKPASPVEVYQVKSEALFDSVEVLGNARANESVDVSSNVTETIREIHFRDGEYVLKGQILALMEQGEEQAQLKAAEAQLAEHERELVRIQKLLKNKAASIREAEERETLVEISRQTVEEIKARIADRTIKAPFDGVLGIRQVSVGALVSSGDLLTTIDDINSIKLDFYVPSIFLPQLKEGNPVKATVEALNNRVFEGKIDTINTRVDALTRSVLVRAVLPNPDLQLKPGLLMKIKLIRNQRTSMVVPEESIIQRQRRFYVLVVDENNIATEREVQVGTHYPAKMEILEGIAEGEQVVVRGVHTVRSGQEVNVQKVWDEIRAPITDGL